MPATRDFTKTNTKNLIQSYRRAENDNGTMTMAEECRRMALVDGIGAELRSRGVNPDARSA